ncbi:hypothetical protein K2173_024753 [Erythroxylum novogranatense]|uniref:Uncharacterized protein n=1 Tax=Erythroxylum novogranatense TaxID=1862640 RepID=A0AAV8SV82_9ROSI|nr:hypothetical protein K2173_024753 [Erythroxylum novogranatense]
MGTLRSFDQFGIELQVSDAHFLVTTATTFTFAHQNLQVVTGVSHHEGKFLCKKEIFASQLKFMKVDGWTSRSKWGPDRLDKFPVYGSLVGSWMQSKLNGKQGDKKQNAAPTARHMTQDSREEFSDWANELLTIGTFGNAELKQNIVIQEEEQVHPEHQSPSTTDDGLEDFTPEEIGKLQKELTKLLSKKPTSEREKEKEKEKEIAHLPIDRFLNCPSTLEKMFVCRSGFSPQSRLRDTLQESRMEKLLRTLLHKKINPQNTPRSTSVKKYLKSRRSSKDDEEEEDQSRHTNSDGYKWLKTHSEYIVLEI